MTEHLTDEQLAGYRTLDFLATNRTDLDRASAAVAATRALVREVDRLRAALAAPITVEWTGDVSHSNDPADLTTVKCFDVDHPTRDVILRISLDNCEALGSMLLDPPGPLDEDGIPICACTTEPVHQHGCPHF